MIPLIAQYSETSREWIPKPLSTMATVPFRAEPVNANVALGSPYLSPSFHRIRQGDPPSWRHNKNISAAVLGVVFMNPVCWRARCASTPPPVRGGGIPPCSGCGAYFCLQRQIGQLIFWVFKQRETLNWTRTIRLGTGVPLHKIDGVFMNHTHHWVSENRSLRAWSRVLNAPPQILWNSPRTLVLLSLFQVEIVWFLAALKWKFFFEYQDSFFLTGQWLETKSFVDVVTFSCYFI